MEGQGCVPLKWREGLIVNLFKKSDKEDPLLSVVGKVFCKVVSDRLVRRGGVLHEAGRF